MDIFDDSSDEDVWELVADYLDLERVQRPRLFLDRTDPFTFLNDEDFRMRFRLRKDCYLMLLNLLNDELIVKNRTGSLSPTMQLMLTLRFYCTGSFQVIEFLSFAFIV